MRRRGCLHEMIQKKRNKWFSHTLWARKLRGLLLDGQQPVWKGIHQKFTNDQKQVCILVIRKGGEDSSEEIKISVVYMRNRNSCEISECLGQVSDNRAQRRGKIHKGQEYMVFKTQRIRPCHQSQKSLDVISK